MSKTSTTKLKKEVGIIGLGKMGGGMARRLLERGWKVHGHVRDTRELRAFAHEGVRAASSPKALVAMLSKPRIVILMVPAGKVVDAVLFGKEGLAKALERGDIVIDSGNSFYKDAAKRAKKLAARGITFVDVGFSGGPSGARNGGCLMVGGDEKTFTFLEPLFKDLAKRDGYRFFKGTGAGHFVKMIHNGIEYGMMQSLAEGFAILKKSKFKLNLKRATEIYNNGSVIESRLVGWLKSAYDQYGEELKNISGSVGHTGEGKWTAEVARELGVPAEVIEKSFTFRIRSKKHPSYTGKVVSALRGQFGGHDVKGRIR